MKKLPVLFCMLVLIPMSAFASHFLQGTWVNERYNLKIGILSDGEELTVFGVEPQRERGQSFRRVSRKWYRDRYGNSIKVEDDDCLEFRYFGRLRKMGFRKVSTAVAPPPAPIVNPRPEPRPTVTRNVGLEGTWFSEDLRTDLYIIQERNGFKVAFKKGEWRYFERLDRNIFKDYKGNTYTLQEDGGLIWVSADRAQVYKIIKKSDILPW